MILGNPSFVRAETKAWLFCAVEKDDVNIIKTFYDIPGIVRYHKVPYNTGKTVTIDIFLNNMPGNLPNIPSR